MMSTNTIIATVVVLLILAALGWMLWKRTQAPKEIDTEEETAEVEAETTELVNAMQTNPVFEDE